MANRSGLPEDLIKGGGYQDHGCRIHDRCQPLWNLDRDGVWQTVPGSGCPIVDACIYDAKSIQQRYSLELHERNAQLLGLVAAGVPVDTIALQFGVTARQVYRIQNKDAKHRIESANSHKGEDMPVPKQWVEMEARRGTNRNVELLRQLRTPAEARAARAARPKKAAHANHERNVAARAENKETKLNGGRKKKAAA